MQSLLLLLTSYLAGFLDISNKNLERKPLLQSQKNVNDFKDKLINLLHREVLFQYDKVSIKT